MLLTAIRSRLDQFSKAERRVGECLLNDPEAVLAANISALARKAQVSEPTVVRFCRTIGYAGWHEFKLKLAQSLAIIAPDGDEILQPGDIVRDIVDKVCARSIHTLLHLRNYIDTESIEAAIDLLKKAKKIELYAQGTSGAIAIDAQHKFFRAGISTTVYSDPHIHSISASLLQADDVVFVISQRGNNAALLRSVQLARKNGADVITLGPRSTPLAASATVAIPVGLSASNADPYTPISMRLAHLVVIDILTVGVALRHGPEFRKKMQNAQKSQYRFEARLQQRGFVPFAHGEDGKLWE